MTTQTQTIVNDVDSAASNFFRNLGNGILAAEHLSTVVHSVVSSRDTTIFARYLNRVVSEKKDLPAARAMRTVFKAVYPDAKIGKDKSGKVTFKIAGCDADKAALARMDQAVKDRLSIRGTFASVVRGDTTGETKVREAKAVADSAVKMAKRNGLTREMFLKLIEAEWNDVKIDH